MMLFFTCGFPSPSSSQFLDIPQWTGLSVASSYKEELLQQLWVYKRGARKWGARVTAVPALLQQRPFLEGMQARELEVGKTYRKICSLKIEDEMKGRWGQSVEKEVSREEKRRSLRCIPLGDVRSVRSVPPLLATEQWDEQKEAHLQTLDGPAVLSVLVSEPL